MRLFIAFCVVLIAGSLLGLFWLYYSRDKNPGSKPFNRTISRPVLNMPCAHDWIEVCRHCGKPRDDKD